MSKSTHLLGGRLFGLHGRCALAILAVALLGLRLGLPGSVGDVCIIDWYQVCAERQQLAFRILCVAEQMTAAKSVEALSQRNSP